MIDKIISYLAQGFSQQRVGEMVGCTDGYVSKVIQQENYAVLLEAESTRLKVLARDEQTEKKYETLETRVLSQMSESLPFAEFRDLTRTMEVLIKRKQQQGLHANSIVVNQNTQTNVVVLSIPQAAVPDITLNNQREVIAIGKQTLAPMQASSVRSLFATLEEKKRTLEDKRREEQTEFITSRGRDRRGEHALYAARRDKLQDFEEETLVQEDFAPIEGPLQHVPQDF